MTEYKTIPGVSSEAVSLILDSACNSDLRHGCLSIHYEHGLYEGYINSLQSILSSEERPAEDILNEALDKESHWLCGASQTNRKYHMP